MAVQYGQYRVPPADEMVNFGVGQPAPSLLPLAKVREASAAKFAEEDPLFLQYGYISGYPAFREVLAKFLSEGYGKPVTADSLFVTNGISGTLGLLCSLFVGRGDVVVVEEPSYFLALSIFRDFGLTIVPVGIDENGLRTDELEDKLATEGLRPAFVYTIPAFHNPTSFSMSHERKKHLVSLARKYDFMVWADEVYQLLGFTGVEAPPPPMCYYDEEGAEGEGRVISMGSFAKILAPAMRLGWFQVSPAAKHLLSRVYNCGQLDSSGGINPVISGLVHTFITSGYQAEHLAAVKAELTQRAITLGDALRANLPEGASFVQPRGGYFIWIKLPAGLDGAKLLEHSIGEHKVRFHPGERFGTNLSRFIRLSFSYYGAEDLATGAVRLGASMRSLMAKNAAAASASGSPSGGLSATGGGAAASSPSSTASGPVIRVAVHGATGRLGSLIVAAASGGVGSKETGASPSGVRFAYAGPVVTRVPATTTATTTASGEGGAAAVGGAGATTTTDGSAASGGFTLPPCDVIIDVSLPTGTATLLSHLTAAATTGTPVTKIPLVIGTTGDLPWDAIRKYASASGAPVVVSANFSAGVPLVLSMLQACKNTLPSGWHAEVTEIHHTAKVDAPSGTAKRIVTALDTAGVQPYRAPSDGTTAITQAGATSGTIPVHALRLGDTIGQHTVYLAGPGERVEVTHTATRRDVFALGALRTAAWVKGKAAGVYVK